MYDIGVCTHQPFLYCKLPKSDATCNNPDYPCMSDVIEGMGPDVQVLEEDALEEGYGFQGIEAYLNYLNTASLTVWALDGRPFPWKKYRADSRVIPNTIAYREGFTQQVDDIPHHHARGSMFGGTKCYDSLLYAFIDKEKLKEATGRSPHEVRPAVAGSVRHDVVSIGGTEHESLVGVPREHYNEHRVAYRFTTEDLEEDLDLLFDYMAGSRSRPALWDLANFQTERLKHKELLADMDIHWRDSPIEEYVIKGTADSILSLEKRNEVVILDWKRSRFFKNGYAMQMSAYASAVAQMGDLDPDALVLISVFNRFDNQRGEYNLPTQKIMHVEPDGLVVRTMKLKTVFLHTVVQGLVQQPEMYLRLRDEMREVEEDCNACEVLYSGSPCVQLESELCDIVYDFVREGGDLADILIDGFEIGA